MIRVLITGMSAVGKSTVARRLTDLGFKAVDVDYGGYSESVEAGISIGTSVTSMSC